MVQHFSADRRISCDIAQHCGHVGCNHSRAFGNSANGDHFAIQLAGGGRAFRKGVGGHDGLGGHMPACLLLRP